MKTTPATVPAYTASSPVRRAVWMWLSLTSWTPMTISRPASAAIGICSARPAKGSANTSTHTPCMMAEARVRAPELTLAELRTITPVMGSPPIVPETTLAAPWPTSSRLRLLRVRVCIRSTATAVSRLSTLAMSATVSTPAAKAPHLPSGRLGNASASISEPLSWIRGVFGASTAAAMLATTIATRGPGTLRSCSGTRRQAIRMTITSVPTASPGRSACPMWTGSAAMLCQAELCVSPPSRTWICCRAIVIPIPASIACTTIGEIASAARPARLSPNRICRTPAPTVMAQVTAQPNWEISPATITVRPAAGPLTCSGDPPSAPATTPPTMAAISPASGGAPEAIAIPRDSGSATRNTTSEAGRS